MGLRVAIASAFRRAGAPVPVAASVAEPARAQRVQSIDSLRGIAAFIVMAYHYTIYGSLFDRTTPLYRSIASVTSYGHLGVPIFFVISGFVLPFSLATSNYSLADAPRFVAKRLVRLEPTYLLSIALVLGLWWMESRVDRFDGPPVTIEPGRFFSHFAYLADVTGHAWYVRNYWTLGLEFQFYLAIALCFPLMDRRPWFRAVLLAGLIASDLRAPSWLFACWGGYFALGIAVFFARDPLRRRWTDVVLAAAALASLTWGRGTAAAVAGGLAAVVIFYDKFPRMRPLVWLGAISYSLYLFHGIVGQKVVNLGGRFATNDAQRIGIALAAMAATMAVSWLVCVLVEWPSQRLASKIRYRSSPGG